MNSTLTIPTFDAPPVSLTFKRVHLLADMLEVGSAEGKEDSVTLVETERELRPFLDALAGKTEAVEGLNEEGWESLASTLHGVFRWQETLRRLMVDFHPGSPLIREFGPSSHVCASCVDEAYSQMKAIQAEYLKTLPNFPMA
ncbi:hypothetical protein JCM8547_006916 [Rhodosporidiobolus lusitaniae]